MQVFDFIYYALAIAMMLFLLGATVLGLRNKVRSKDSKDRRSSLGISLTALGALLTISETVILTALFRGSAIGGFLYQEVQYSVAYFAFAIVLFGVDITLLSNEKFGIKSRLTQIRIVVWSSYFLAIAISSFHLFNPSTYTVTYSGSVEHVAQQLIFWLPLFLTLVIGAVEIGRASCRERVLSCV
jgi:hypothetical protein